MSSISALSDEHVLFTEAEYGRLLDLAKSKYAFCSFDDEPSRPFVVWRHDIDHSAHRALALAKLEAERGLKCIYHVLLTSRYYNVFEPEIARIFRQIADMGHEIGLHFDMDVFGHDGVTSVQDLERRVRLEREVVEAVVGTRIHSMSFHNTVLNSARLHQFERIAGLFNASAPEFARKFRYVSDSNGIWRYDRLRDILQKPAFPRLYVLTHPEWWTTEALPPVERLRRIVDGRAVANFKFYADLLIRDGRMAAIGERIGFPKREPEDGGAA